MEYPLSNEVPITKLIPGEEYYAISAKSYFRGMFTEYWTNIVNYPMVRFNYVTYKDHTGYSYYIGSPQEYPWGSYWRIWDGEQSYKYYKVSRFTKAETSELKTRCILRERRQIERGLTGSTASNLWLPRDLVREISLNYLTDKRIHKKSKYDTAASRLAREYHGHSRVLTS
jgi:hypothetical protein